VGAHEHCARLQLGADARALTGARVCAGNVQRSATIRPSTRSVERTMRSGCENWM
jgi:hypothetical protein